MHTILGLNAYHGDAAAALVVDGTLVAAAEEERFNRVKHCAGFPYAAAKWCLEDAGVAPDELDVIAVGRDPRAHLPRKLLRAVRHGVRPGFIRHRLGNMAKIRDVRSELGIALQAPPEVLRATVRHVEHHQAHAASAFFVSPFDEAAILSVDGFGDFTSTMLAVGRGSRLEVLDRVLFPHSLGVFYTAVTQWLGFPKYGDEGKVMGLAPYGQPTHLAEMRELVRLDGRLFQLGLEYFTHQRGLDVTWQAGTPSFRQIYSKRMEERFGPGREAGSELTELHENVAASMQAMLEEAYLHLLDDLWRRTGIPRLCLAGGVALNAVANGLIRPRTPFQEIYVQPAAGDSGTAVGAAFYVWNHELGCPRGYVMEDAGTGPEYSDEECARALRAASLEAERLSDDELFPRVADRIAAGEVVGWFQGRMEFGPRALGNRSIVTDPRRPDMKDILNARIKHREPFRPFAPSILAETTGDWFEQDYTSPFMVLVYKTREEKRTLIPAVNHVDDTGRLQTVEERVTPRYWRLIKEFERRSGVPIVLNTSFNENEPIVMTPEQAVDCFLRTRMDTLVLGNHFVSRNSALTGSDPVT